MPTSKDANQESGRNWVCVFNLFYFVTFEFMPTQKPRSCFGCPLEVLGTGFAAPEGLCSSGVLLIGEALGEHEAAEGLPFRPYAPSGAVLERAFHRLSMNREQFGIFNTLNCRPPGNRLLGEAYELPAIAQCNQHLRGVHAYYNYPKVIVALGAIATRTLTGLSGSKLNLELIRGFPIPVKHGVLATNDAVVIPTFHPSFIAQGESALMLVLQRDIRYAVELAKTGLPQRYAPSYKLNAGVSELRELLSYLKQYPEVALSYDWETLGEDDSNTDLHFYKQKITQCNFSVIPGHAVVCDFNSQTRGYVEDIMSTTSNPKFGHNVYSFDERVAKHNGFEVKGSRHDDTMLMFNFVYKDLPGSSGGKAKRKKTSHEDDGAFAALQFCASFYGAPFPWKHLSGEQPHLYGAYDADFTYWVRNGAITDMLNPKLDCYGAYDIFVRQLQFELRGMERRGIPINRAKMLKLSNELGRDIDAMSKRIQIMVPEDLKPVGPKKGIRKKSELNRIEKELLEHGFESEYIRENKISQRHIPFTNEKCECVKPSFTGSPDLMCSACIGRGTIAKQEKTVKCDCASSRRRKLNCELCDYFGYFNDQIESFMFPAGIEAICKYSAQLSGKHRFKTFPVASFKKRVKPHIFCVDCGLELHKKPKFCKCHTKPDEDCAFCSGSGKRKEFVHKPCKCTKRMVAKSDCQDCGGSGIFTGTKLRFVKVLPFLPSSPNQMLRYALGRGYKIPKNSKGKLAMDKETIIKLAKTTGDPVFTAVKDTKEWGKVKSSYADSWLEKAEGEPESQLAFVHTEFTNKPATGQLSSINPSVQVTPNESKARSNPRLAEVYKEFRESIEAPEGYSLIELDMKSFHVLTLGYEARDADYIRLARLDAHSYLAANMLQLPGCRTCISLPDAELKEYLKYVKQNYEEVRNKKAKPGILGFGFGLGARSMYLQNQDSFASENDAAFVIDMLVDIFPLAARYRTDSPMQAHKQTFLRSSFGCVRWFMDVMRRDAQSGKWVHGGDWERAIAYRPANNAFCVLKLAMLRLGGRDAFGNQISEDFNEKFGLINQIHDALLYLCPNKYRDECIHVVKAELERPVPQIVGPDGLPFWCETDVKVGKNWSDMKEVKL